MDPFNMYFLLNMGIFHCYVSLADGNGTFTISTGAGFGPSTVSRDPNLLLQILGVGFKHLLWFSPYFHWGRKMHPIWGAYFLGWVGQLPSSFLFEIFGIMSKKNHFKQPNLGSLSLSTMGFMKINMKSCPPFKGEYFLVHLFPDITSAKWTWF